MKLCSRSQMAEKLDITTKTLDKLVKDGLPSYRVGKQLKFDDAEVREWLRNRSGDAKPILL